MVVEDLPDGMIQHFNIVREKHTVDFNNEPIHLMTYLQPMQPTVYLMKMSSLGQPTKLFL